MAHEDAPPQDEWYPELLTPMDNRELSPDEQEAALATVRLAMGGIEAAIAAGHIVNVQVTFEVVDPTGNIEFNYSAPKEEE